MELRRANRRGCTSAHPITGRDENEANEVADKIADKAAKEPLFGMQPFLEEHGKNNLDPEIDAPAADCFIEEQRSATMAAMQERIMNMQPSPISKITGARTHTMMSMIHPPLKIGARTHMMMSMIHPPWKMAMRTTTSTKWIQ
jgi:hypothetical protein